MPKRYKGSAKYQAAVQVIQAAGFHEQAIAEEDGVAEQREASAVVEGCKALGIPVTNRNIDELLMDAMALAQAEYYADTHSRVGR